VAARVRAGGGGDRDCSAGGAAGLERRTPLPAQWQLRARRSPLTVGSPRTPLPLPPPPQQQALAFEAFRDVVRFAARGLRDADGIRLANDEHIERRAHLQAALQAVNQAAFGIKPGGTDARGGGAGASGPPAGSGMYGAVGFSYGSGGGGAGAGGAAAAAESSSDDDSDEDSDDDEDGPGGAPATEAEVAQEAEDDRVDDIAAAYGLADFSYRLHRTLEREGDDEARMRPRPRCGGRGWRPGPRQLGGAPAHAELHAAVRRGPLTPPLPASPQKAQHEPQEGAHARQAHGGPRP
jgi:hypothetical protein